ncbi:3'-5' exonuclease [Chryseobacterium indoltheticum]|uniref:DNA polymerase III polC-type n=1 Tax=Chryseobacterium indoltheticum TaxID=254 RepID=A0A381FC20_9FLAO|nr:3'-5' exonuclease [Chryseobacterium indoltheticum]AZA73788.1 exonuclease domain-containing protein [Chryseobacterium indoltheticum]SIQ95308.1 Exonuclease [Chryseobacterium indoltheticum]SUX44008.1 DNA polymerase III polC-type [Chryseobacterium indoltheticum]
MKFSSDLVIFDLEGSCKTFGQNEINDTNIIEIGAVKLDKKTFEIKDEFSILIKPKHFPILPEITAITNISNKMVENKKYFDIAILEFLDWYGEKNKSTLAGWGLYYDLPLLRKEFSHFGFDYNKYFVGGGFDIRALGVYWLAKNNISTSGISLKRVLEKMNLTEDFKFHRALDDAKATALILQQILNEK